MARRGRPTKEAKPGTKAALGLRVTADVKKRLEAAANLSGRTQSQEAEYRLERSFDRQDLLTDVMVLAYGSGGAVLLLATAMAMDIAGRSAAICSDPLKAATNWYRNPFAYQEAMNAFGALLEEMRPKGDVKTPPMEKLALFGADPPFRTLGANAAADVLKAIKGRPASKELGKWAEGIRRLLGEANMGGS